MVNKSNKKYMKNRRQNNLTNRENTSSSIDLDDISETENTTENIPEIIREKVVREQRKNKPEDSEESEEPEDETSVTDIDSIGYPQTNDPNFQSKIYKKREFYYYKLPDRPDLTSYKTIADYRKKICEPSGELLEHQALLSNFINPDTPYKGLLLFHGTGTGKCVHPNTIINGINMKIEDIWNNYYTNIVKDEEKGEWSKTKVALTVKSLNNKGLIVIGNVLNLYREYIQNILIKITLENGYEIIKTIVHKLYNGKEWLSMFNIGQEVCYINAFNNIIKAKIKNISLEPYKGYVYDLEVELHHNFVANNILCHNTCAAIAIAERFKSQVQRYRTQIYILVPGPLLKESWKEHFLKCTGDTYLKSHENLFFLNEEEKEKIKKQAIANAVQFYKIMSYKSFYKRVLGEKITEKKVIEGQMKTTYKKTEEGEYERDIGMDVIQSLNNTLIIVEEAHNLTGNTNTYGEALMKIIKNSINLKVILLTATPMKNFGSDIVDLLNFIRPIDSPIERDKIFTSEKNHLMQLKASGLEYLKKMAQGYISHLRGADPMTFAKKIEMGDKPKGLMFTRITRCYMNDFQLIVYNEAKKQAIEDADALDRKSEAVANFVFPGLDESRKKLIGLYGKEGLNTLRNQLKNHYEKINELVAKDILGLKKTDQEFININENTKNITGAILKKEYLKHFSTKFHQALEDLEENLYIDKKVKNHIKESRTGFVYSNLVKTGIQIFQEVLNMNGYLQYDENSNNYQIKDDTICYYCKITHKEHPKKDDTQNEDSHNFAPSTYLVVTGQASEENAEVVPGDNKKIITKVFNNIDNKDGKKIKLILGSKVMNEGISLANVYTVQILDVYFNFGRVDQVVGRAIRWCSHYNLMNESNVYPKVKLYKYAVSLGGNELSTEEELYQKAEMKYLLIKKVERALKEVAIDCALNQTGNMFKDEYKDYKNCETPNKKMENTLIKQGDKYNTNVCPSKCDFDNCYYKCNDKLLNEKYYDPNRHIYRKLKRSELDYSTFTTNLAKSEIDFAKKKIKELYMTNYVYNLKTIMDYIRDTYPKEKKDLFDEFFVQKGLDELIPITENDFNNFKDIIYDKTYRPGYLIYLDEYYIFQPFDENENAPMYYRTIYQFKYESKLSLYNYLVNEKYEIESEIGTDIKSDNNYLTEYNFDEVMDYYDNRNEYKIVGIIDKETNKKKGKRAEDIKDIFKIREKREKILDKKRGTGIPSLKGAVCSTSKSREYLEDLAKDLDIKFDDKNLTRENICDIVKEKLIELEKYSTGKNKMTYIIVPSNHPILKFPLNLEDRVEYIKEKVNNILSKNIKIKEKISNKNNKNKEVELSFILDSKPIKEDIEKLEKIELKSKDKIKWTITIK